MQTWKRKFAHQIKTSLKSEVIGLGFPAHIVHNCARTAKDTIPVNIERILIKSLNIFIYSRFVWKDWKVFESTWDKNIGILWHTVMPDCWWCYLLWRQSFNFETLKSFFLSEEKCSVVLHKVFEEPCTKLWLAFNHANETLFHYTIKLLEGDDCYAAGLANILISKRSWLQGTNTLCMF